MGSRYTPITIAEMREAFSKKDSQGKGWLESVQGRSEIVFDYEVAPNCIVRVWTSLSSHTDNSRGVGDDAIRVCAYNPQTNRGLVKSARVYRIATWRENLKKRLQEVIPLARSRANQPWANGTPAAQESER